MVLFFKSHQIQIYRQRRIGSTNRFTMSATFTSYYADIQPEGLPERIQMANSRVGSVFRAYVEVNVNIKEGDQVVANGKRYSVKGVQKWENASLLDSLELMLVSQDGN